MKDTITTNEYIEDYRGLDVFKEKTVNLSKAGPGKPGTGIDLGCDREDFVTHRVEIQNSLVLKQTNVSNEKA